MQNKSVCDTLLHLTTKTYIGKIIKSNGDVPKWLKGPHSKCGRSVTPAQEFKSLHLRQYSGSAAHGAVGLTCGSVFLRSNSDEIYGFIQAIG